MNYIFNSSIQGIEESDLILLIGTNPRYEATMLNARRKTFVQKSANLFNRDAGDFTYDYQIIGKKTDDILKIIKKENDFSKKLLSSKTNNNYWKFILELKSGKYIFEKIKEFLNQNSFITKDWNALNVLVQNASTVGLTDLKFSQMKKGLYLFRKFK